MSPIAYLETKRMSRSEHYPEKLDGNKQFYQYKDKNRKEILIGIHYWQRLQNNINKLQWKMKVLILFKLSKLCVRMRETYLLT